MSQHEYENDHEDDRYENDDHDDDHYYTGTSISTSSYAHTENESDNHYTATSTNTLNDNYTHGYQFAIANGAVTGITEIEHGYAQQERVEYGETWTVNGNQVVKTEIEHGFTQTSVYADTNGDGIFTKVSQSYSPLNTSTSSNVIAMNAVQGGNDTDDVWNGSTSDDHYYGSVGNDLLHGGYGDDDLFGGNDNDHLYGDVGDDHLYGSNGNDYLYGGVGTDAAYYEGNHSEYALMRTSSSVQVADTNSLRDGEDVLESVERIHFSDISYAFDTSGAAGAVYRLYEAAFDRAPKDVGEGYWLSKMDNGTTLEEIANEFVKTSEFQDIYGGTSPDYELYVSTLFQHVLGRSPKESGLKYWAQKLVDGESYGSVLAGISESSENIANTAPLIENGIPFQNFL